MIKTARRIADSRQRFRGYDFTPDEWSELCWRYGNRCAICGEEKPLTVDHIKPRAAGGTDDLENIQPLCRQCNSGKNSRHEGKIVRLARWSALPANVRMRLKIDELRREKAFRERRDISLTKALAEAGLPVHVQTWVRRNELEKVTLEWVHALCRYFNVRSVTEFIEYVPDPPQDGGE